MNPAIYSTIAAVAGIASATVAVWNKSIDAATYASIVVGALGIAGVTHVRTNATGAGSANG